MNEWMNKWMNKWAHEWINEWMSERMNKWLITMINIMERSMGKVFINLSLFNN